MKNTKKEMKTELYITLLLIGIALFVVGFTLTAREAQLFTS
jgi:hypothetical protein